MWRTRRGGRRAPRIRASGRRTMPTASAPCEAGPAPRRISNRVFNDLGQNLFSENKLSQWVWVWGQFIDHDIGLRDETPAEDAAVPFDSNDPLEQFANDLGQMAFNRTPAAPGTGTSTSNPRQQINTNSSVIDASQVYGNTAARLAWLKAPNGYDLLLPGGDLPHASDKPGAPVDGPDGAADGQSRRRNRRGRRACQREHRADVDSDPVRARAQSHRGRAPESAQPGCSIRDRAPCRRRGDPAHHLHGIPACSGRFAPALFGLQAERRSVRRERVRNRGLPRPQHGARRIRADLRARAS